MADERKNNYAKDRAEILVREFYTLAVESEGMSSSKSLKFREYGDSNSGIDGWRALAIREANELRRKYRKDDVPESEQNYQVCLTRITEMKREINKLAKTALDDEVYERKVINIATAFSKALSFLFAEDTAKKNFNQRARVENRSDSEKLIECNPWQFIAKAESILKECYDRPDNDSVDWRDVSCALALVTGRRQSEIHSMAEFSFASEYEVFFKGQSKGKLRECVVNQEGLYLRESLKGGKLNPGEHKVLLKEVVFKVPTLVRAEYVVAGLQWLEDADRRVHGEDEIEMNDLVNKRYNKPIGLMLKANWSIVSDEQWQEVDQKDKMTYHKLRGIWFKTALKKLDVDFDKGLSMAHVLLGDADTKAIHPYRRVRIVEEV